MTASPETTTGRPKANSISVPAHELRRALTAVLPHCGQDDTLPALTCVKLEARGGWLYLVATDRYSMGVARVFVMGGCDDQDAMLPAKHAKALRRMLKGTEGAAVALTLAAGKVTAAYGKHASATWAARDYEFPAWRGMLGKILTAGRVHLADDCGLNGDKLARFALPDDPCNFEPLHVLVTAGTGGTKLGEAVVFLRGGWFLGALMPARHDSAGAPAVAAWTELLAPAEPEPADGVQAAADTAPAEAVAANA